MKINIKNKYSQTGVDIVSMPEWLQRTGGRGYSDFNYLDLCEEHNMVLFVGSDGLHYGGKQPSNGFVVGTASQGHNYTGQSWGAITFTIQIVSPGPSSVIYTKLHSILQYQPVDVTVDWSGYTYKLECVLDGDYNLDEGVFTLTSAKTGKGNFWSLGSMDNKMYRRIGTYVNKYAQHEPGYDLIKQYNVVGYQTDVIITVSGIVASTSDPLIIELKNSGYKYTITDLEETDTLIFDGTKRTVFKNGVSDPSLLPDDWIVGVFGINTYETTWPANTHHFDDHWTLTQEVLLNGVHVPISSL